ncbi:murein DD-endopeptidase MepM/ murein hydrolase activator NlpD [Natronospira proteinivora]|uniref:Murein DD-endopeptidase MepM/ murein hydrolase activator NlpD n=1 Tax=Natronospira proteinivora TaxID=1807133 RepID=A0ABT1GBP6_9GAMM|nr:peptidoglycan DD-metalloendopeptidase family protein [Natronospira proteinivora]MCP1728487.1 murein DD-endopeptidase MepM/ murein hydrolase activator NlpD [Natronospira proteinivora]
MVLITSLSAFSGADKAAEEAVPPPQQEREIPLRLPDAPLMQALMSEDPLSDADIQVRTLEVKPGETLARLFQRNGLNRTDLHHIMQLGGEVQSLARLSPGDQIEVRDDGHGNILGLSRQVDSERILHVHQSDDGFEKELETLPVQRQINYASGEIKRSLYQDARAAGLSNNLIMNLAGIFQWDIDFILDIRDGDEFVVIYEEIYRDGEKVRDGDILAAEIVNRGNRIQAVSYTDPEGDQDFYTPDGDSMRRTFLRAPLEYMRISSHFNPNRRHPTLNRIRAHRGVDYAAPTGTPIRAAGDGRIVQRGRRGGYGNTIQIRHGERYQTLYAHMSRFASGLSVGSQVQQGDVIGYVGQTGLATGPHLHYEFLVDGVHRNPVTVDFPAADPVGDEFREDFLTTTAPLVAHLELMRPGQWYAQRSE